MWTREQWTNEWFETEAFWIFAVLQTQRVFALKFVSSQALCTLVCTVKKHESCCFPPCAPCSKFCGVWSSVYIVTSCSGPCSEEAERLCQVALDGPMVTTISTGLERGESRQHLDTSVVKSCAHTATHNHTQKNTHTHSVLIYSWVCSCRGWQDHCWLDWNAADACCSSHLTNTHMYTYTHNLKTYTHRESHCVSGEHIHIDWPEAIFLTVSIQSWMRHVAPNDPPAPPPTHTHKQRVFIVDAMVTLTMETLASDVPFHENIY